VTPAAARSSELVANAAALAVACTFCGASRGKACFAKKRTGGTRSLLGAHRWRRELAFKERREALTNTRDARKGASVL
jgi:hypothetical protein